MNIKLDENLPERLVTELHALGHDVDTVRAEGLAGRDDSDIWQAAQSVDRFLITQDLDFPIYVGTPERTRDCCSCASRSLVGMLW